MESSDPTVIRSIAVTAEDVVSALELNRTSPERAVLRITPPFSGRMRARLHVEVEDSYDQQPAPVHVDPDDLVADPPAYPLPAETEDELRSDPEKTYSVDRHHDRHRQRIQGWREAIPPRVRERILLETPRGSCEVAVTLLAPDDDAE